MLSDTVFKIRSATSVLRRVVRSGYKEADLRYEKSGGAERTVRFSFLNGLALSGQAPAAADARRGVFRPERICGLHAAGAVPHCAGVEFGMSFTCGGAFVGLVPAIIRFIRKKTPTSGNYVTFVRPTTIS